MSLHRVRLLLLAGAAACASDDAAAPTSAIRVDRVVLVSVDGLRGDALSAMPVLSSLLTSAVWTDRAHSVEPALTLPAHLSMLTGRDVTELGIASNTIDAATAATLVFAGVTTVFDWLEGPSDAVIGASLLPAADLESARAFFGLRRLVAAGLDDAAIVDAALGILATADVPDLLFVHLPGVDLAGHEFGWVEPGGTNLSEEYLAAVRRADAQIGRLHAALAPAIAAGNLALIVTADHGGGHGAACGPAPAEREHCTAHPGDQLVPLVMLAARSAARRLDGEPSITRVAPTIAMLLGSHAPWGAPLDF